MPLGWQVTGCPRDTLFQVKNDRFRIGKEKDGNRLDPELLIAVYTVLDTRVILVATTLTCLLTGLAGCKAKTAAVAVCRIRGILLLTIRANEYRSQPSATFLTKVSRLQVDRTTLPALHNHSFGFVFSLS
jgi:hypothetical protein